MSKWYYEENIVESIENLDEGAVGFIYMIINTSKTPQMFYIGKKSLYSSRKVNLTKKEINELENKRLKKWKIKTQESDWLEYNGSCKPLLEDIAHGDRILKIIIKVCFSKIQLTYEEVKHLFNNNVLERDNCYNSNIASKWFKGNIGLENKTKEE